MEGKRNYGKILAVGFGSQKPLNLMLLFFHLSYAQLSGSSFRIAGPQGFSHSPAVRLHELRLGDLCLET